MTDLRIKRRNPVKNVIDFHKREDFIQLNQNYHVCRLCRKCESPSQLFLGIMLVVDFLICHMIGIC